MSFLSKFLLHGISLFPYGGGRVALNKPFRIAVLLQSPIYYTAGLMKTLAHKVDLHVYYCSDFGVLKPLYISEFNTVVKWDVEMLSGFKYSYLTNLSPFRNRELNPGIVRELMREKYDALIVRGYVSFTSWLAFLTTRLTKTPLIIIGEADLLKPSSKWKRAFKRLLLRRLFKSTDAFLYSCTANAEYYKRYGASAGKMFFVPSAVDNEFYQKQARVLRPNKSESKQGLGFPSDLPIILSTSKLIKRKRPADILEAFEGVQNRAGLVFVGDGPLRSSMERLVRDRNIHNVKFIGFKNRTEISRFYALADIFVLASDWDPSPKALHEAMNFSLPVVVSDKVGTSKDLVKQGKNGFIFPVGDVGSMRNAFEQLIDDVVLRSSMGQTSLSIVSEWNYEKGVAAILDALRYVTA